MKPDATLARRGSCEPVRAGSRRLAEPLKSNEIHVWIIGPQPPNRRPPDLQSVLCAQEVDRVKRFKFPADGLRWAFFRSSLRNILALYTDRSPADIEFTYQERGKPQLPTPSSHSRVHFNLSHSGGLALLAVTHISSIGVDIEYVRPLDNMPGVAARFFSLTEHKNWLELPPSAQVAGFYHCWTRKEAVIKALGLGLSAPLAAFDVPLHPLPDWELTRTRPPIPQQWAYPLLQLDPAAGYTGAVALCTDNHAAAYSPNIRMIHYDRC